MKLLLSLLVALPLLADETAKLHALFDRAWEARLKDDPLLATSVGRHEYNDRLPAISAKDLERQHAEAKALLAELGAIDRAKLRAAQIVKYDMFRWNVVKAVAGYELGDYQLPINADSGVHTDFSRLSKDVPLATVKDYDNYVARLRAWPAYVRDQIAHMRRGLERGMTIPRVTLEGYDRTISAHVVDDPAASVFWEPFAKFPSTVPASEHERLRREGRAAVAEGAIAGYRALLDFFQKEYFPGARKTLGASALPNG